MTLEELKEERAAVMSELKDALRRRRFYRLPVLFRMRDELTQAIADLERVL